ncbi:MAG: 5-formyltetrahydrofolate cyclo-ligase [Bacillota bacterium]
MDKQSVRRAVFKERDALTPEQIKAKSAAIAARLYALPAYRACQKVLFFLSFRSEVNTRPMVEESLRRGKQVLVPKAVPETRRLIPSRLLDWEKDIRPGAYGIPEPHRDALRTVDPGELDLVIVPGAAFDQKGNRLGYGGGYYDRFFSLLKPAVPLVALAFELQIAPALPVEHWDRPVDCIITEERVIFTGGENKSV